VSSPELLWKQRVEEPTNRFLYYPIARWLVQAVLLKTRITANQVTLAQPLIAAFAAYLIVSDEPWRLVAGAVVFECRSILDCADGTLARERKTTSAAGHALDGWCDWASMVIIYTGIYLHFRAYPPPPGAWSAYFPMGMVVGLALFEGGLRSFAADYFLRKYSSIIETGRDATVEGLRDLQRSLAPDSSFGERVEAFMGRCQHLVIQQELFDAERTQSLSGEQAQLLIQEQSSPLTTFIARLWSLSNGDVFVRITVLGILFGHVWMWHAQLFLAFTSIPWIIAVIIFNNWFIRRTARRAEMAVAR